MSGDQLRLPCSLEFAALVNFSPNKPTQHRCFPRQARYPCSRSFILFWLTCSCKMKFMKTFSSPLKDFDSWLFNPWLIPKCASKHCGSTCFSFFFFFGSPPSQTEGRIWRTVGAPFSRMSPSVLQTKQEPQTITLSFQPIIFTDYGEPYMDTRQWMCTTSVSALLCLLKMYFVIFFFFLVLLSCRCCICVCEVLRVKFAFTVCVFNFRLAGATTLWCKSSVEVVSNLSTETNPSVWLPLSPSWFQNLYIVSKKQNKKKVSISLRCPSSLFVLNSLVSHGHGRFWFCGVAWIRPLGTMRQKRMCLLTCFT